MSFELGLHREFKGGINMDKLIFAVLGIILVLGGVKLTNYLVKEKKMKINRWIIGFISPWILIIPSIAFESLPDIVWQILGTVFALMCIVFFEISRIMVEENRIKGAVNMKSYNKPSKKAKGAR